MINKNSTICRKDDIVVAELDGKAVMMSMENGQYYGLDEIASAIWNNIEKPIMISDLVTKLSQEYSISQQVCQKDVIEFLETLKTKNLIEVS